MLGEALASILRRRLGQYLDTQDLEVSVAFGKEIVLRNVKLKESALRDAGIPLRCVYGKVQELSINIPWTNIYNKPTEVKIEGLYMLIVPSSTLPYNQEQEEKAEHESKMAKIMAIEEAKQRDKLLDASKDDGDSFAQKLVANIFKNLQISVKNVHIRIEDNQKTNKGYPFGAGITLDNLVVATDKSKVSEAAEKAKSFHKLVNISNLAFYWQPHEKVMYSEMNYNDDKIRDIQFEQKIARKDNVIKGMKYLLGPVSISAEMAWCPEPKKINFAQPLIHLDISMEELKLHITKYQYHDFAMLLHSVNSMVLSARYRKYKAKNGLDGVPNYAGRSRSLWRFATESILEEEVRPSIRNWSLSFIMEHTAKCREYRELYKDKLLGKKSPEMLKQIDQLERELDGFNISINRERAEAAADAKKKSEQEKSGYFSWIWGSKSAKGNNLELQQLGEAFSQEERDRLYEAIGYQENAEEGILDYPKRFIKYRLQFILKGFSIRLVDEELQDATVLTLRLDTVSLCLTQRPAAANIVFQLAMQSLTVTGIEYGKQDGAKIVTTISSWDGNNGRAVSAGQSGDKLLNFEYEINPPADPLGNLDTDKGSVHDRRLHMHSSPLEIIYDMKTFNHVMDIFKAPEEIQISYLQEAAMDNIKDVYKEVKMSKLGLEYVIQNHKFLDVDIQLQSSYIVIPTRGAFKPGCPCLVANLGKILVKSAPVTTLMVENKKLGALTDTLKRMQDNLLDQAYDKFYVKLENMELMMSMAHEDWRQSLNLTESRLHILKPINLELDFKYCLISTDPEFPITKLTARLPVLGLHIEESRLLMLAEILDTVLDPDEEHKRVVDKSQPPMKRHDSNSSFSSALSSLGGGSTSGFMVRKKNLAVPTTPVVPTLDKKAPEIAGNIIKLAMNFSIDNLNLDIMRDEEAIFRFAVQDTSSNFTVKSHKVAGRFEIGSCVCEQLQHRMPDGTSVRLLHTDNSSPGGKLLSVKYNKTKPVSPEWEGIKQHLSVELSSVNLNIHQDAILDLAKEAALWLSRIKARAKKLTAAVEQQAANAAAADPNRAGATTPLSGLESPFRLGRQGARRLSRQNSGDPSGGSGGGGSSAPTRLSSIYRPKRNTYQMAGAAAVRRTLSVPKPQEVIDFKFSACLRTVKIAFLTSYADFAWLETKNLSAEIIISPSTTTILAQLKEFKVYDSSPNTGYSMIAESTDQEVFDLDIKMYELSEREREKGLRPDVGVKLKMGRIRFVFLMKFIRDLLLFIDPFTNLKDYIAERTREAVATTSQLAAEVYRTATRVQLDIELKAPVIVLPLQSDSTIKFEANLGHLKLNNSHHMREDRGQSVLMDVLELSFTEIMLERAVQTGQPVNRIVQPITFNMEVTRNMHGARKKGDTPDIQVQGTLHEIFVHLRKDDYDCIISLLTSNFTEIGVLKAVPIAVQTNSKLGLPLKKNYNLNGSKSSLSSGSQRQPQQMPVGVEKEPDTVVTTFDFKFTKFSLELLQDAVHHGQEETGHLRSLACIMIDNFAVDGEMTEEGVIDVHCSLQNIVLDDRRHANKESPTGQERITQLLHSKAGDAGSMAKLKYTRDPNILEEKVDIKVDSFVVVASVSYLLTISDFFVPQEVVGNIFPPTSGTAAGQPAVIEQPDSENATQYSRIVVFEVEEPDIMLVSDIDSVTTDALLLNTKITLNLIQRPDDFALQLLLDNLRGHTCKFDPLLRDETMAQILRPTNMAMHFNRDYESNRTRIDINFKSLVLNVSPAAIMIILQSYQTFMENFHGTAEAQSTEEMERITHIGDDNIWEVADVGENEFWFLKTEEGIDAACLGDTLSLASTISLTGDELLMVKVNQLIVTLEAGHGNNTTPMILVESKVKGELRNWSSRLSFTSHIELEAAYYNSTVALWEPILEPVQYPVPGSGHLMTRRRWNLNFNYHANSRNDLGSAILSPNFQEDEADGFICPESLPPLSEIELTSMQTMQITITRTFLSVVNNLLEAFSLSGMQKSTSRSLLEDLLIIRNQCGKEVRLSLGDSKHVLQLIKDDSHEGQHECLIPSGSEEQLKVRLNKNFHRDDHTYLSPLLMQSEESEAFLKVRVSGEKGYISIPISKTDVRFFPFQFRGDEHGYEQGFVSAVTVENQQKIVTIRSLVTFKNYYPVGVKIWQEVDDRFRELVCLNKGEEWNSPITAVYTPSASYYFSLVGQGEKMSIESLSWKDIEPSGLYRKEFECSNTRGDPSVFLKVEGTAHEIFRETSRDLSSRSYTISIRPMVVLKNCLPYRLEFSCGSQVGFSGLEVGDIGCLEEVRYGHTLLRLQVASNAHGLTLSCDKIIDANMKELEYWRFESIDAVNSSVRLELGVQKEVSKGTTVLTIFAPFWFVNKTKEALYFKGHDSGVELEHGPEDADSPIMFSYVSKGIFSKKKIQLRLRESHWSDSFTIDTIGDTGKVTCKRDPAKAGTVAIQTQVKRNFLGIDTSRRGSKGSDSEAALGVGIQIEQSSTSLTKIVTFTPYYMAFNSADFNIQLKELEDGSDWVEVPAGECVPLWPLNGHRTYVARVPGEPGVTVPFSLLDTNPCLLMLANKYQGIDVRVKIENSQVLISLGGYRPGYAPVLIINNCFSFNIKYWEQNCQDKSCLAPGKKCLYTWQKPSGSRMLVWEVEGLDKHVYENTLKTDSCGSIHIRNNLDLCWVSFLDGMQRILLFTHNVHLADRLSKTTGEMERIEQEVTISLYGIGVSLVNNAECVRKELAYLTVSSSNIVWEVRREGKQRYKPLTLRQCQLIEADFCQFRRLLEINSCPEVVRTMDHGNIVVNYQEERMEAPLKGRLRRQYQNGFWLQLRTSPHQRQIHFKVNHIQLDNQLAECLYPVIAAPVPPPKSVTADSVPKPFIEVSVLEYTSSEHTHTKQYKYIHALVQEMQFKVELGFINAISELFEEEEILEDNTSHRLALDLDVARKPLKEHAILTVSQGKKDFFDYLHFSPLKVHVSFSLTSYNCRRDGSATRGSNFINLLLQSFGVTVTDSSDIIFRLAYFERKHQFYGFNDLTSEIFRHYKGQAIKQMYVILLGLDVIGNPFGLAVGVARSVEDLFYEPFQGAVEGPSEFAEGLAIGVRSVFSGVVGGAAGTVSKITGALGKGLATLTFDEKFQKKRRENIKRRENRDLMGGMAVNVRDLSMGFVGGVTGVITKPVEGAIKEGAKGFFKGVGKGVAGLVTRPTGGIVDFASGTFDTVKRATEMGEDLGRVRPARYIHPDGVVRYYDRKEADGLRILNMVEKGRYAAEDTYMLHEYTYQETEVFLVTNNRMLYLNYSAVLGNWSVEWEFDYKSILQTPPSVEQENGKWYIIIQPKEEKKSMLGGLFNKNSGKKVFLPEGSSKESAQLLARVIEDLRRSENNFESIFIKMILSKEKLSRDRKGSQ